MQLAVYIGQCFSVAFLIWIAIHLVQSFAVGFVQGFTRSVIEAEVERRITHRLSTIPAVRPGDRMIATAKFLRELHRMSDYERVPCVVVDVVERDNGVKDLVMRNLDASEL